MMPIAVLPVAGLLLRFGQPDVATWLHASPTTSCRRCSRTPATRSSTNLSILFAVGVAIGFARKVGRLHRAVGRGRLPHLQQRLHHDRRARSGSSVAGAPVSMGVLDGIIVGIIAALLYQRYYRIKLPDYLAFFGGRRFVPIVTGLATTSSA